MRLDDLLDVSMLHEHIDNGNIRCQSHPTEPLWILNYTAKCQYERQWDPVTTVCRGLIVSDNRRGVEGSVEVVARPFPKFFNYGEHDAATLDLDAPVDVRDKLDGSLGILYRTKDGYAIATRGSFTSDQALRGTEIFQRYVEHWIPALPDHTYLFEIIYPENRIVVQYPGIEDLVLLGVLRTDDGSWVDKTGWKGPRAEPAPVSTLREALALPPRTNAEGLVVRYASGLMIKIKQDDYVALHRLVTGLNERTIWEMLGNGETTTDICARIPEEFHEFVEDTAIDLNFRADCIYYDVRETFVEIQHEANVDPDATEREYRKRFAALAMKTPDIAQFLFLMLDEKSVKSAIWKTIKPTTTKTLLAITEDTA